MPGVRCPHCLNYVLLENAEALAKHIKKWHPNVN